MNDAIYPERWTADIATDIATDNRALRIRVRCSDRSLMVPSKLEFVPLKQGDVVQPFLTESRAEREDGVGNVTGFLQAIIDAAWDAGMRPSQYRDSTQELKAVRYHLEDMRALSFGKPKP